MDSIDCEKPKKQGKVDREQLIAAIRAAVEAEGGGTLTFRKFISVSKMSSRNVFRHFSSWIDALHAAGFVFERCNERLDDDMLLRDWGQMARKLERVPTRSDYGRLGRYHEGTLSGRFGGWPGVMRAFRAFAGRGRQWADVLAMLPAPDTRSGIAEGVAWSGGRRARRFAKRQPAWIENRPVCGEPIYAEGMSHAPVNESGVMLLFGAMAARLGFTVESSRSGFPDCEAKRRIGPGVWQTVRIEFEFESRNFREHGHVAEGCDLIVCWEHNWPDCPKGIGVIALKDELERVRS